MKVYITSHSFVGKRETNQDKVFFKKYDKPRGDLFAVMAVADGMGGMSGGEVASKCVVDGIRELLGKSPPKEINKVSSFARKVVKRAKEKMNNFSEKNGKYHDMGSTLVMCFLYLKEYCIVNVGDSRAYEISENDIIQISQDHTALADAIRKGLYDIEEAKLKIKANSSFESLAGGLIRSINASDNENKPDIFKRKIKPDSWILLCSDGMTGSMIKEVVNEDGLYNTLKRSKNIKDASYKLAREALEKGSTDNISTTILQIGNPKKDKDYLRKPDKGKHVSPKAIVMIIGALIIIISTLIYISYQ